MTGRRRLPSLHDGLLCGVLDADHLVPEQFLRRPSVPPVIPGTDHKVAGQDQTLSGRVILEPTQPVVSAAPVQDFYDLTLGQRQTGGVRWVVVSDGHVDRSRLRRAEHAWLIYDVSNGVGFHCNTQNKITLHQFSIFFYIGSYKWASKSTI